MSSLKKAAASLAGVGIVAGMVAFAPAASADNYAPELPSNRVDAGSREPLKIDGGQPGCRVTFTIEDRDGNVVRGPRRTGFDAAGDASSSLRMPTTPGVYRLITRVDDFPGKTGCTPSKTVQRIVVS